MSIKITRTKTGHICDKTNHYYGSNSNDNDVISIPYGSVWYLRDNPRDPESDYHPHIVIYDCHMDKIGRIATFSITSTPSIENMVPIIFRDSIGYINWHHPINYKISEFNESGSKFLGTITESDSFNISMMLYSVIYLKVGRLFGVTKEYAIDKYLDYIDEFEQRAMYYNAYCHKYQTKADLEKDEKLNLHITWMRSTNNSIIERDEENVTPCTDANNSITTVVDETETVGDVDGVDISTTMLSIDFNSTDLIKRMKAVESTAAYGNTTSLPKNISDMSTDDVVLFFALLKTRGGKKTSLIYGCNINTIWNKRNKLLSEYDVTYIEKDANSEAETNNAKEQKKQDIVINVSSKDSVAIIKSFNSCSEKLPRCVAKMSYDDIKKFLLCLKVKSLTDTALIYNCCKKTISKKQEELLSEYNVTYIE